jgi:hypothetical protein
MKPIVMIAQTGASVSEVFESDITKIIEQHIIRAPETIRTGNIRRSITASTNTGNARRQNMPAEFL